jgi:acyl carrier protein
MANELFRLLQIFREILDNEDLTFEASSMDPIEGWDSLAHVQLMLSIEEEFDVTFTTEETAHMTSIPAILAVLREKEVAA